MNVFEPGKYTLDQLANEMRQCRECKNMLLAVNFSKLPPSRTGDDRGYSTVCKGCSHRKGQQTREEKRIPQSKGDTKDWAAQELIRNYKAAVKLADRIRCLEALVKLMPDEAKGAMDEPSVIKGIMQGIKRREAERGNGRKRRHVADEQTEEATQEDEVDEREDLPTPLPGGVPL